MVKILKKAIGYLRRSDRKQKENASLETQKERILALAAMLGYEITYWAIDDGVSAYHKKVNKRRGMNYLVQKATDEDIRAIFFYHENRLTRQTSDFVVQVYLPLMNHNPDLLFYKADTDVPWNPYDVEVMMHFICAQHESAMKSKRVRDSQMGMLSKKTPIRPGARVAFGYDENFQIKHDEAAIVNLIYRFASVGYSNLHIASILTEMNIPSPENNTIWNPNTISHILKNPTYIGDLIWDETLITTNFYEPIISRPLWEQVKEIKTFKQDYKKMNTPFTLKGLVHCGDCNIECSTKDSTPGKSKIKYLHYICPQCKKKVNAIELTSQIIERVNTEWTSQYDHYFKNQKKHLNQLLNNFRLELREIMHHIRKNRILTANELKLEDLTILKRAQNVRELSLSFEKIKLSTSIEKTIQLLRQLEHPDVRNNYRDCDIEKLNPIELRAFSLLIIQCINLHFGSSDDLKISVDYRLHPSYLDTRSVGYKTEYA